jgi:hypothetical protein
MQNQVKQTPEAIADLKVEWLADPHWDIADTEGFEAHRDELEEFEKQEKRIWDIEYFKKVEAECNALGCSPKMLARLNSLGSLVETLAHKVAKLEGFD